MLTILCALALLEARRPLTRENLAAACRSLGGSVRQEEVDALLLLLRVAQRTGNRDPDASGAQLVGASLEDRGPQAGSLPPGEAPVQEGSPSVRCDAPCPPGGGEASLKGEAEPVSQCGGGAASAGPPACYVYGVAEGAECASIERPGVDGNPVYVVLFDGLAAVVHRCQPEAYATKDDDLARSWVESHNAVLEECLEKFPAVLPCTFNTILYDPSAPDADAAVSEWLKKEAPSLKRRLEKVRGKREYGVQVFWDPKLVAEELFREDGDLSALKREVDAMPPGAAYMYREKLEKALKSKMESLAAARHREFMERIRKCCSDLKVEKNKRAEGGLQMIGNWSCLLAPEEVEALGSAVEEISNIPGYQVRFTGPWPPYSFGD